MKAAAGRQRDRLLDRQQDRQWNRKQERQQDRQNDRQRDWLLDRQRGRQLDRKEKAGGSGSLTTYSTNIQKCVLYIHICIYYMYIYMQKI